MTAVEPDASGLFLYVLALGADLGSVEERAACFEAALAALAAGERGAVLAKSPWRLTDPLPHPVHDTSDHKAFLNGIAVLRSSAAPELLYARIRSLEDAAGHSRSRAWAPRSLDIDILLAARMPAQELAARALGFESTQKPVPARPGEDREERHWSAAFCKAEPLHLDSPQLVIPHPGLAHRPFLIAMLCEELGLPRVSLRAHGVLFR